MKKLLLLFLLPLMLNCCKDDDDNTTQTNPIDLLPQATQIGANTAGCLVDGEAFLPFGNIASGNLNLNYTDGLNFGLTIKERISSNSDLRLIGILHRNLSLEVGVTYTLNREFEDNESRSGVYTINIPPPPNPNFYSTNNNITGELTITHHDFNNAFMSGTFWFDAINSEGKIVEIREGRFDMEY